MAERALHVFEMRKTILACAVLTAGCANFPIERPDEFDGYWLRNPYYTNNLALTPRTQLAAYEWLDGTNYQQPDGTWVHTDWWHYGIEIGFRQDVEDPADRLSLAHSAIEITCPKTDLTGLDAKVEVSEPRFIYIVDIQCFGFAGGN